MGVFLIILIIELISLNLNVAIPANNALPCKFQDSINITEGTPGPGGTIIYNDLTFQRSQYADINYFEIKENSFVQVSSHLRGCPCQVRPCIRLCCPFGKISNPKLNKTFGEAYKCQKNELAKNMNHEIFDQNNKSSIVDLSTVFSFVSSTFSKKSYIATEYQILQTGQILEEHQTFSHQDYCLRAKINEKTNEIDLTALISFDEVDSINGKDILFAIAMMISVPFIAATFMVYMFLPELRNLHGKCLLCYLFALMIGYSLIAWLKFNGWHYMGPIHCKLIGHLAYFSLISAFIWSNIISFDLHRNFRASRFLKSFSENKRFLVYMVYGWGVPMLITLIVILLDQLKPFSDEYLPSLATQTCFFKHAKYGKLSPFLYFYMIIIIIYSVNIVYFVLTALKIREAQRDIIKITSQQESSRHQSNLNNERDNFILYMRLFIVMGATYIMEGITFLTADPNNKDSNIFVMIVDLWNMLQGLIIFILFVLKRRVIKLILKRYHALFGKSGEFGNGSIKTKVSTDSRYSSDKAKYREIH